MVTFIQLQFFFWDTVISEPRRFHILNLNLMKLWATTVQFTLAKRSSFILSVNYLRLVNLKQLAIVLCKRCLFDLIFEWFKIISFSLNLFSIICCIYLNLILTVRPFYWLRWKWVHFLGRLKDFPENSRKQQEYRFEALNEQLRCVP